MLRLRLSLVGVQYVSGARAARLWHQGRAREKLYMHFLLQHLQQFVRVHHDFEHHYRDCYASLSLRRRKPIMVSIKSCHDMSTEIMNVTYSYYI